MLHFPAYAWNVRKRLLLADATFKSYDQSFSRPIVCVDSISEISFYISLFPTEKNTVRGQQKYAHVFETYLAIAITYAFSESRFGIYAKSCIYTEIFGVMMCFWCEICSKAWFWSKSCFCCSRTVESVPDQTDPGFGFAMVESTPHYLESCFFLIFEMHYVRHSLWIWNVLGCYFYSKQFSYVYRP